MMRTRLMISVMLLFLLNNSMADNKLLVNGLNSGVLAVDKDDTDLLLTTNGLVSTSSVGDVSIVNRGVNTGDATIVAGNRISGAGFSRSITGGTGLGGSLTGVGPRTVFLGMNQQPRGLDLGSLMRSVQSIGSIREVNSYRPQLRYVIPNRSRYIGPGFARIHPRRRSRKPFGVRYYKYSRFG